MTAPIPEEFHARPDTYEGISAMFVEADYYKDGELVHSTVNRREELPEEQQPGWTVQGARRGQTR